MRTEAGSLEALLGVLRQRMDDEQVALASMAERLMSLGDETGNRLGQVTRDLGTGAESLAQHSAALDRAAENARTDIGVLLSDLPQAEQSARALAEELRVVSRDAGTQASLLEERLTSLTGRAAEANEAVGTAAERLGGQLGEIERAGASAGATLNEVAASARLSVDDLLDRATHALSDIRNGIDNQSAAVNALLEQSAATMGRAGADAAEAVGQRLDAAGSSLDALSTRIAEQDRASQSLVATVERSLADLDQRFVDLAAEGDLRANSISATIQRVRGELDALALQSKSSDGSLEGLTERTNALRTTVSALHAELGEHLGSALADAEGGAERLLSSVQNAKPEIEWMNQATLQAAERMTAAGERIGDDRARLDALLGAMDAGVGSAEVRLSALREAMAQAGNEAGKLQSETAPALVQAMVQVREAATHAAERAREALARAIPDGAERLSSESRTALERVIAETVTAQVIEVEKVAARAVAAAQTASERLTGQLLTIGQTAAALEQHIDKSQEAARAAESEGFGRRTAMLIDSMHSAAIDVGKILSTDVDDRNWQEYLKGDRGVFTRRAVRLLNNSEQRSLANHYDSDREFQTGANRFVADFEAMLRRVLGERDGGPLAVTLMSSDMGKLYAALSQIVAGRR
jgi:DNA repair exonuclease SbcCD ATPase subunit